MSPRRGALLVLALALAPSGCASQDKPVAVRGVVTQDGKPVPGVSAGDF